MKGYLGIGTTPRRCRAQIGALAAGFLLAYLIAVSPHLVHHALETDHGRPSCPLLIQSQQTTAEPQHDLTLVAPVFAAEILAAIQSAEVQRLRDDTLPHEGGIAMH